MDGDPDFNAAAARNHSGNPTTVLASLRSSSQTVNTLRPVASIGAKPGGIAETLRDDMGQHRENYRSERGPEEIQGGVIRSKKFDETSSPSVPDDSYANQIPQTSSLHNQENIAFNSVSSTNAKGKRTDPIQHLWEEGKAIVSLETAIAKTANCRPLEKQPSNGCGSNEEALPCALMNSEDRNGSESTQKKSAAGKNGSLQLQKTSLQHHFKFVWKRVLVWVGALAATALRLLLLGIHGFWSYPGALYRRSVLARRQEASVAPRDNRGSASPVHEHLSQHKMNDMNDFRGEAIPKSKDSFGTGDPENIGVQVPELTQATADKGCSQPPLVQRLACSARSADAEQSQDPDHNIPGKNQTPVSSHLGEDRTETDEGVVSHGEEYWPSLTLETLSRDEGSPNIVEPSDSKRFVLQEIAQVTGIKSSEDARVCENESPPMAIIISSCREGMPSQGELPRLTEQRTIQMEPVAERNDHNGAEAFQEREHNPAQLAAAEETLLCTRDKAGSEMDMSSSAVNGNIVSARDHESNLEERPITKDTRSDGFSQQVVNGWRDANVCVTTSQDEAAQLMSLDSHVMDVEKLSSLDCIEGIQLVTTVHLSAQELAAIKNGMLSHTEDNVRKQFPRSKNAVCSRSAGEGLGFKKQGENKLSIEAPSLNSFTDMLQGPISLSNAFEKNWKALPGTPDPARLTCPHANENNGTFKENRGNLGKQHPRQKNASNSPSIGKRSGSKKQKKDKPPIEPPLLPKADEMSNKPTYPSCTFEKSEAMSVGTIDTAGLMSPPSNENNAPVKGSRDHVGKQLLRRQNANDRVAGKNPGSRTWTGNTISVEVPFLHNLDEIPHEPTSPSGPLEKNLAGLPGTTDPVRLLSPASSKHYGFSKENNLLRGSMARSEESGSHHSDWSEVMQQVQQHQSSPSAGAKGGSTRHRPVAPAMTDALREVKNASKSVARFFSGMRRGPGDGMQFESSRSAEETQLMICNVLTLEKGFFAGMKQNSKGKFVVTAWRNITPSTQMRLQFKISPLQPDGCLITVKPLKNEKTATAPKQFEDFIADIQRHLVPHSSSSSA